MTKDGCRVADRRRPPNLFARGVRAGASSTQLAEAIKEVFLAASGDLSWLSPGDTVLLKPALNSPDPYPATTHPQSLRAVADLLRERGARVVVGDGSSIRYVLSDETGVLKGSSGNLFEVSGMGKGSCLDLAEFEQRGWEEGFYKFQSNRATSWPDGFYVSKWIQEADHIVNLPRLSTHAQTGVSLGFKNMVGFLRSDSRVQFHSNGPFYSVVERAVRGTTLDTRGDNSDGFFRKITEVCLAVQEKLRVTLFTATRAQVTVGPDRSLLSIGRWDLGVAHTATPNPGLVFASSDALAAEVFALAFLTILYAGMPSHRKFLHRILLRFNRQVRELGTSGVWENPFVVQGLRLGLGGGSVSPQYRGIPCDLQDRLNDLIKR